MERSTVSELGRQFIELHKLKFQLENDLKEINSKIPISNAKLVERLEEEGLSEIVVDDIKLTKKIDETFSLTGEATGEEWDQENGHFHTWVREIGEGALIKKKEFVHHMTRTSWLKRRREQKLDLPEFIKVGYWKHVKVNLSKLKRMIEEE